MGMAIYPGHQYKAYLHYIDWNDLREDPAILDITDFEKISQSEALFARKFDEQKSRDLLDQIDARLRLTRDIIKKGNDFYVGCHNAPNILCASRGDTLNYHR
jgi:hypothetical protein